ncbi:MAG TPA: DUF4167 domain-containing protein [Sphingomicrobium sp.]|nr:DUF4167 domain-containing protein [Sphingomicrobium sp.]
MINNRQGGRRRGRGGQRGQSLGGNRQDNRQRGNAAQLLEKYKNMARDAQLAGDRVQSEYYLQFADHYFRVLGENRARFEDQRRQRGEDSSDEDENDTEDETVEAPDDDREDDNRRPRGNGRDRSRRNDRNGARQVDADNEDEERLPMSALPPAIGRDSDDDGEPVAKPRRRTRKPRNDGDETEIAPAA